MHFGWRGDIDNQSDNERQGLATKRLITRAFYDNENNLQRRTLKQIGEITGFYKSTICKHVKELMEQKSLEGSVEIRDGKFVDVFSYNERVPLKLKQRDKIKEEVLRLFYQRYPESTEYCATTPCIHIKGKTTKGGATSWRCIPKSPDDPEYQKLDLFFRSQILETMKTLERNQVRIKVRLHAELLRNRKASDAELKKLRTVLKRLETEGKVVRHKQKDGSTYTLFHEKEKMEGKDGK